MASFTGSTGSTHLAVYPSVSSSSTLTTLCPHCCNTILAPYVTDVLSLPPSNPVDCPTHCGATFCSQSCSLSPHHRSICVGECAPTDCLLLLKNLVAENHHQCPDIPLYPIFCMSLQLLNAAIPPVVPVATDLFPSRFPLDDPELIEIVSNLVNETYKLLPYPLPSCDDWSRLLSYTTTRHVTVTIPHPIPQLTTEHEKLMELVRVECEDVVEGMSDEQVAMTVVDKPVFGTVEYHAVDAACQHRCYGGESLLTKDELEEEFEVRKILLGYRGITCGCVRCDVEENGIGFHGREVLRDLIELGKGEERYDDVVDILDQILMASPDDAEAAFERARVEGYRDDFEGRERMLREAASVCPQDERIGEAVRELDAYFNGAVDGEWDGAVRECVGEEGRVFVAEGVIGEEDCRRMIEVTEEHLKGEWTTARHYAVPTTDSAVYKIPQLIEIYNRLLQTAVLPMCYRVFGVDSEAVRLRVFDSFIVKYDAVKGQKRLPLHNDQSVYSLTIALNDGFEGGGTFFMEQGRVEKTGVGGVVAFDGGVEHAGEETRKGTRYIIAAFLYEEELE